MKNFDEHFFGNSNELIKVRVGVSSNSWSVSFLDACDVAGGFKNDKKYREFDFSLPFEISPILLVSWKSILKTCLIKNTVSTAANQFSSIRKLLVLWADSEQYDSFKTSLGPKDVIPVRDDLTANELAHIKSAGNTFDKDGFFSTPPSAYLKKTTENQRGGRIARILDPELGALTHKEVTDLLLGVAIGYRQKIVNVRDAALVFLSYETAARTASFPLFRWSDFYCVELDGDKIWWAKLWGKKGHPEQAEARISKTTAAFLLAYRSLCMSHYKMHPVDGVSFSELPVFLNLPVFKGGDENRMKMLAEGHLFRKGKNWHKKVSGETIRTSLIRVINDIGLISSRTNDNLILHSNRFRHTGATFRAAEGCSISEIRQHLRHKDDSTASVYVDLVNRGLADQIDEAFAPVFTKLFEDAKRSKPRPLQVDPKKVIHFFDPKSGSLKDPGECQREARCLGAPFSCVAGCPKFERFDDVPLAVWQSLLETVMNEKNDFSRSSTPSITKEYDSIIEGLLNIISDVKGASKRIGGEVNYDH